MRTYLILKALFDTDGYLTINSLKDLLNVSKRTIQNELSYLKKGSLEHGYVIRNTYGKGYFLEVLEEKIFQDFLEELNYDTGVLDESQLINDELSLVLLRGSRYTAVTEIAESLDLSKTFVYEKNKIITEYLNSYKLTLERKSHFGIRIIGKSADIRKLMLDLYMDGVGKLHQAIDEQIGNFDEYERVAENEISKGDLRIGYYEFQRLMSWLKIIIMYQRLFEKDKNSIHSSNDYQTLKFGKLLAKIEQNYKIRLNKNEIREFNELLSQSSQLLEPQKQFNRKQVRKYLLDFFTDVDKKYHSDYRMDQTFMDNLLTHLEFLIDRLDQQVTYKNPLLLELCIRYSMVFDVVLELSDLLKDKLGYKISNDELGFIAVHFLNHLENEKNSNINNYEKVAVICTTGGGVSNLIKSKILTIFPSSQVETFSFWQESDIKKFGPDIIFSVVPLKNEFEVPIIYIRELLSDQDVNDIRHMLFLRKNSKKLETLKQSDEYLSLFDEELFKIESDKNYKIIIEKMALELVEKGYARKEIIKNVLLRERYMSTVYINGIAIPHPIEMNELSSVISMRIIKPAIFENGKEVKIIFMICLAKKDLEYYSAISSGLFKLMKDVSMISNIYNQKDFFEIKNLLKEVQGDK